MADGFFLGGLAEGAMGAQKQALAERSLTADVGLRQQAQTLHEKQFQASEKQQDIQRGDALIANSMAQVQQVIQNALSVGRDPATVMRAIQPMVASAKQIAAAVGRDPNSIDAAVQATLTGPTGIEAAKAAGAAEGTKVGTTQVTAAKVLTGDSGTGANIIIDPKQRAEMEKSMSDDYRTESKDFRIVRDFKDRMDSAPKTGAGDLSLVFSFMKILDPPSSVREGEQASARNAAGVPEAIRSMYNNVIGGGKLSDEARNQLKEAGGAAWEKALGRYNELTNQTAAKAQRYGINPRNVMIDYTPEQKRPAAPAAAASAGGPPPPPQGFTIIQ